jgi:hypothetical protein
MPYPDDRYPKVPTFPRQRTVTTTGNKVLVDKDWYEVICSYIEDMMSNFGSGVLPVGTEDQTLRYTANATLVATSTLKIHTNGVEVTNDHPLSTNLRLINALIGTTLVPPVAATSCPIGTIYIRY